MKKLKQLINETSDSMVLWLDLLPIIEDKEEKKLIKIFKEFEEKLKEVNYELLLNFGKNEK